jgi:protocatechuate 3,4-dioxygenase beta subunit
MYCQHLVGRLGRHRLVTICLCVYLGSTALVNRSVASEETDILEITVGAPTLLHPLNYQNAASLSVSRTGVVAAFYPKAPQYYRTSTDGGVTWGPQMNSPRQLGGGSAGVPLRDGGVLKFLTCDEQTVGEAEFRTSPMAGQYKDGWFTLHSTFAWFNDDFTKFEVAPVQVYMPDAPTIKQTHLAMGTWPIFADDKMIQLANGDLLASMQGSFKGDAKGRTILCISSDKGHKWRYYSTVAYDPQDPNPDLPGQYLGYAEPSIELLPDGQMICVMRTQYAHINAEYRPIHVSWSDDLGKTWTKPVETKPHLMNICPELAVLDNGVLACEYGRPGFHIAFSLDNGHTWQDRISFSHLPEPNITGQFDMVKAGPNKLVAIGNDGGGTKVWPVSVERVKVSPTKVNLQGRVLDERGNPIANATIERSPNRYAADDWQEHETDLDRWGSPTLIGSPRFAFRSIQEINDYPTVRTDAQGRFRFDNVKLGEYVLTVEADRYTPQQRHIKVRPQTESADFTLKPGRLVRGRVVDAEGDPIGGVCVVLNHWHCHTDPQGYYHWSVEAPVPARVPLRVYKRYNGDYETLKTTVAVSQLESQPITLKNR